MSRPRATPRHPVCLTDPEPPRYSWERVALAATGIVLLLILAVALAGCAGPQASYVAADRATYGVIAPAHAAYIEADPTLSRDQKDRRLRTLGTWDTRIRAAERADREEGSR